MFEVAVLYGFDLYQIFTPIILRLYQPHSLCEKGATKAAAKAALYVFLLPPLREGRHSKCAAPRKGGYFYSRPYARGDLVGTPVEVARLTFLLAPLREGRPVRVDQAAPAQTDFYSRPYARGDPRRRVPPRPLAYFYSRPYARGDSNFSQNHKLIYMINC